MSWVNLDGILINLNWKDQKLLFYALNAIEHFVRYVSILRQNHIKSWDENDGILVKNDGKVKCQCHCQSFVYFSCYISCLKVVRQNNVNDVVKVV